MSWYTKLYKKMALAAFLDSSEMGMVENWISAVFKGLISVKAKIKVPFGSPAAQSLNNWFGPLSNVVNNIWTNFVSGSPERLEIALSNIQKVEDAIPKITEYIGQNRDGVQEIATIKENLENVRDTLQSVKAGLDKKKQQQGEWSNGTPPAQPQLSQPRQSPKPIPQSVPPAAAIGNY